MTAMDMKTVTKHAEVVEHQQSKTKAGKQQSFD